MDLKPPPPLDLHGDILDEWVRFKQRFFLYLEASEKSKKSGKIKTALLLCSMGDGCLDIFNNFTLQDHDKEDFDVVVNKFDDYFKPRANTVVDRYKFFNIRQNSDEPFNSFVNNLKTQARKCQFGDQEESLVRDLLIIGVKDEYCKERLLMESDLKLDKAIQYCKAREESQKQVKLMKGCNETDSKVQSHNSLGEVHKIGYKSTDKSAVKPICSKCLKTHGYRNCPAWGKKCLICKKPNHFAKACKQAKLYDIEMQEQTYNPNSGCQEESLNIGTVVGVDSVYNIWSQNLIINGVNILFKLDTGADVNVIPYKVYRQVAPDSNFMVTSKCLKSYSGHNISVLGTCLLNCHIKSSNSVTNVMVEFHIVHDDACPILGLKTCKDLNLVSRVHDVTDNRQTVTDILPEFRDVFGSGLGKLPFTYDIKLKDNVDPKVNSARPIPKALNEVVRSEIVQMVAEGILKEVTEPTDWVHPIVIAKKPNGKVRICIDPRNLNKYIKREHYKMPTIQEIFSQLEGAKYFSVLDASTAFLQIPLSENSSRLCTIATPFGRFRYCRLPYGLNSAPEVFQKAMDHVILGLAGVISYIDDILVFGNSKEEHDDRLTKFLTKAKYFGLKLSRDKSQIGFQSVDYLGHKLTPKGISIIESKLKAIHDYPCPKDKNDLQRFLGIINYVGRFIHNLSDKTGPLRLLLNKNTPFLWSNDQQQHFELLKEEITKVPVLAYFDDSKKSILSVDASKFGLGAVVLQNGHPIGYSSSALTDTQQRYSQIEKELLAVVNGCKKFHYYLYGTEFTIETDHKPLIGLLNKPISSLSPRLQRMVMELMRYNFTLVHVPGKEMYIADSLSRAPTNNNLNTNYLENGAEVVYSMVIFAKEDVIDEYKTATRTDVALQKVLCYIDNGWPEHKVSCDIEAQRFWEKRYELHAFKDLLYMGNRLIIPKNLQCNILGLLHASHQGINSCQNRAKMCIYWPGMMKDIQNTVNQCTMCQEYQRSNPKEPLKPYPVPEVPWEDIGIDFLKIKDTEHMLVIDYHSKFVEVKKMNATNCDSVTKALQQVFRSHGLPKKLHSDNGPPFDSHKFATFTKNYQIEHITSSPYYPKSNGMVERAIQTLKSMLIKTFDSKGDLNLAVIDYNNTPKFNLRAPAQMLMGRVLKTILPVPKDTLKPLFPVDDTLKTLRDNQEKQKKYYDRSSRQLRELKDDENVYMQKGKREWVLGRVVRKHETPNSYIIKTNDGIYRRNRIHLKPAFSQITDERDIEQPIRCEKLPDNRHQRRPIKAPEKFKDFIM